MNTITNKTPSPFDLQSKSGMVRLPAFGSVSAEFDDAYLEALELSNSVTVESDSPKASKATRRVKRRRVSGG